MKQMIQRLFRMAISASLLMLLNGCVTTEEKIFNTDPSDEKALQTYVDLALVYASNGDFEQAKSRLKLAREIDDNSARVHAATGYLMQQQGDLELAEENYRKALEINPDFQAARNNYGTFLYGEQRYQDAHDQFKMVADDQAYPKRYFAYENLGFCAVKMNKTDLAESYFKKALLLNVNLYRSVIELAEIEYGNKNYKAAQGYLNQYADIAMLNKFPDTAKVLWLRIRVAIAQGNRTEQMRNVGLLSRQFPDSDEYELYLRSLGNTSGKVSR
ncbi:MAG: type IV pilus biogenesis/stability protein PilW [Pseudomonadales bacterium]|nr:type IV pilus biogenesis/stability protein PilW [Pseudomonadales bacterium]